MFHPFNMLFKLATFICGNRDKHWHYICDAESLDVLESWVLELFGKVKGGAPALPEQRMVLPIWKAGKAYHLEAVNDVHVLDLSWTLPCLRQEYLKKSEDYLAHLLGHGNLFQCYFNFFDFFDFLIILYVSFIFLHSAPQLSLP